MVTIRAQFANLWYYLCLDRHFEPFMYPSLDTAYVIEAADGRSAHDIAKDLIKYLQGKEGFKQYQLQLHEFKLQPAENEL